MWFLVYQDKRQTYSTPLGESTSKFIHMEPNILGLLKEHPFFKITSSPEGDVKAPEPSFSFSLLNWKDYILVNYFSGEYLDLGEYSSDDYNPLACLVINSSLPVPDKHLLGKWAWQTVMFLKKGTPECEKALMPNQSQRMVNIGVPFARF